MTCAGETRKRARTEEGAVLEYLCDDFGDIEARMHGQRVFTRYERTVVEVIKRGLASTGVSDFLC